MAKELKLPSGKEKVLTTHGEKYWGAYLFLFKVVFVAGFLRLTKPQTNPYGGTFYLCTNGSSRNCLYRD